MNPQWKNSRKLKERIIITGTLVLETPTHIGNGDTDGPLDMPLLMDALTGKALLPGSSLAGALRQATPQGWAEQLFGQVEGSQSKESLVIVDDAVASTFGRELRDGVAIHPETRTAEENKKFDIELLTAGTTFPIALELLLPRDTNANEVVESLTYALAALQSGHIRLGKRKRRGFGKCKVTSWKVCRYDLSTLEGLRGWVYQEQGNTFCKSGEDIGSLLGVNLPDLCQDGFHMRAIFTLDGSLLIRSGFGEPNAPDVVHLHSRRDGKDAPVLSGASLAGALRARARRIANTIHGDQAGEWWTDRIFGARNLGEQRKALSASRLWVEETIIETPLELVQTRVKIDRFTGGSYPAALFSEQPVWGKLKNDTLVYVDIYLEPPMETAAIEPEIGLLLLLLKDLWTGDLPLGGESSVGRGRLQGRRAELSLADERWIISITENGTLSIEGNQERLESFVQAFIQGGAS